MSPMLDISMSKGSHTFGSNKGLFYIGPFILTIRFLYLQYYYLCDEQVF